MFCLNISYFAIISVWAYSQSCRKCYYHVFADPDWPHSRHTLMAIIITTSQPIRAQYSNLLTNHITVTRHQMVAVIRCWPLNHRVSVRPHSSILHSQHHNQATALAPLNINIAKTGTRSKIQGQESSWEMGGFLPGLPGMIFPFVQGL